MPDSCRIGGTTTASNRVAGTLLRPAYTLLPQSGQSHRASSDNGPSPPEFSEVDLTLFAYISAFVNFHNC